MDAEVLGRFIDEHYHQPGNRLFRMEVLPEYDVTSDGDDFRRWLDGATEPMWARKQPWLDTLRSFEGADVADSAELADHLRGRDAAWAAAEPFAQWWARGNGPRSVRALRKAAGLNQTEVVERVKHDAEHGVIYAFSRLRNHSQGRRPSRRKRLPGHHLY